MAITLRQIEAFRAVMEAGTVVEAAGLMHLSQPAVSRLVGELEATLGYALFARVKGRLARTEEGTSSSAKFSGRLSALIRYSRLPLIFAIIR